MPKPELSPRLWTPDEVAERWGLSTKTLRNWRSLGVGPRFIRVGNRARYAEVELARFEADQQSKTA